MKGLFGLFSRDKDGNEVPIELDAAATEMVAVSADDPELNRLRAELASERQLRLDAETRAVADRVSGVKVAAATFASDHVNANRILPAAQGPLASLKEFASLASAGLPTDGLDLSAALDGLLAGLPAHGLTASAGGTVPDGLRLVGAEHETATMDAETAGRLDYERRHKSARAN